MLDVSGEASLGTRPPPEDAAAADESISMLTMECTVNLKTFLTTKAPEKLVLKPKKSRRKKKSNLGEQFLPLPTIQEET